MKLAWMILVTACSSFTGCRGEGIYRDLGVLPTVEDFLPPSPQVTLANASVVVRRSLLTHQRSISTPVQQYGYAFRPDGFVQLCHLRPEDRVDERGIRTYVNYNSISSIRIEPYFDIPFLKDRFRLTVEGEFRRWESHIRSFQSQPDLGAEPETFVIKSLILELDDAVVVRNLHEALSLLSHSNQR
jgi:hypothetical protein